MMCVARNNDMEAIRELMKPLSTHEFTKERFMDCYAYNLDKVCVLVYEKIILLTDALFLTFTTLCIFHVKR